MVQVSQEVKAVVVEESGLESCLTWKEVHGVKRGEANLQGDCEACSQGVGSRGNRRRLPATELMARVSRDRDGAPGAVVWGHFWVCLARGKGVLPLQTEGPLGLATTAGR